MMKTTSLYTIQMANWRLAKARGIEIIDTTAKSGNPIFAPDFNRVMEYKRGELSEEGYTKLYVQKMNLSIKQNTSEWLALIGRQNYALACYCKPGAFCHRHLMARIIAMIANKEGSEFINLGEITA